MRGRARHSVHVLSALVPDGARTRGGGRGLVQRRFGQDGADSRITTATWPATDTAKTVLGRRKTSNLWFSRAFAIQIWYLPLLLAAIFLLPSRPCGTVPT